MLFAKEESSVFDVIGPIIIIVGLIAAIVIGVVMGLRALKQ
jgi:hypothetical protein